jgi:hypothetical protein
VRHHRWGIAAIIGFALAVGIITGITAARAASAYRTDGWINGNDLLSRSATFQSGYIAGMADAMSHVAYNASQDVDWVARAKCLDRDSGLTASTKGYLTTLVDWGKNTLRDNPDASRLQAASILIINACE